MIASLASWVAVTSSGGSEAGAPSAVHQLSGAWGYTQTGTEMLLAGGPEGGLHLYTHHPDLQVGPVTFGAGLLVRALPRVLRNRPGGVLLGGLAVRVLIDPGTHTYYTAGLLLAALAFDLTTTRWVLPWTTVAGFVTVLLPHLLLSGAGAAHDRGVLRAAFTVGAVLVVLAAPASLLTRPPIGRAPRAGPDLSGGTRGRS